MKTQKSAFIKIEKVAVLGSGVMGSQIAAHCANAGMQVLLLDIAAKEGPKNAIVAGALKKVSKMSPPPFMTTEAFSRISIGNFDDDLEKLADVDWVIEVVIENLKIKQELLAKVATHLSETAILTSNTSGLPISKIAEALPYELKSRFFGTHFFNPPRYLQLFEVIPTEYTDVSLMDQVSEFARVHLGKGVVLAKDTPNFIANRIGTYAMMVHLSALEKGYSIAEIDALTGPLTGRPKSATFRTADVVGLDTLCYVSENLYEAIPHDESRDRFKTDGVLKNLVNAKRLGAKTKAGFYTKKDSEILSVNPKTLEYEAADASALGDLKEFKKIANLADRWKALFADESRVGEFIRPLTSEILWYTAKRLPEISDNPYDVDNAIKWGFGWQMGPFEIIDAIGLENVVAQWEKMDMDVPIWISNILKSEHKSIYYPESVYMFVNGPRGNALRVKKPKDELTVASLSGKYAAVWSNEEAILHNMADDVLLLEFRSKANTIGSKVVEAISKSIDIMEDGYWKGLVIGNDGENFSVGANLGEMAQEAMTGNFGNIDKAVESFQNMVQKVRYANKPVVAAIKGKTLGGGCELSLACSHVVAAAETYIGLVELGVGLIPAGTGSMHFAYMAEKLSPTPHASDIQRVLMNGFQAIATAKVAMSGFEAIEVGYLNPGKTTVVMNAQRILHVAKKTVEYLSECGYKAATRRPKIKVLGKSTAAAMSIAAFQMQQAGFASEYDKFLADQLASVLTGGEIGGPTEVSEEYLIELERKVFMHLLTQEKTQARIKSILTTNKPLRN